MSTYLFLRSGARSVFTDGAWPTPLDDGAGEWVTSEPGSAAVSVYGYRIGDLPLWVCDELWEIELLAPIVEGSTRLTAPAGRLLRRLDRWDRHVATEFGSLAVLHCRDVVAAALSESFAPAMRTMTTTEELRRLAGTAWSVEGFVGLTDSDLGAAVRVLGEAAADLLLGQIPLALHEVRLAAGMAATGDMTGETEQFEAAMLGEQAWQAALLSKLVDLAR